MESQIFRRYKLFILSIGTTPAVHVSTVQNCASALASEIWSGQPNFHAGNCPIRDLHKCTIDLAGAQYIARRVLASVSSYYPDRGEGGPGEAMCDARGIAMSRDTGPWEGCDMSSDGESKVSTICRDGIWAGVARGTEASCGGNLRLVPQLRIGEISEKISKAGDGGD